MKEHELKTWPQFFSAIWNEEKKFELRRDDRGFEVGDVLHLREWCPDSQTYTGRSAKAEVRYIVRDSIHGLAPGFCCMSIGNIMGIVNL